jgi:hypothetical protein
MSSKKSIPKVLKDLCWKKWIGEHVSKTICTCCEMNTITMSSFHCGHIQAESHGGKLSVDNLKPICAGCNLSMGSENMNEFKLRCGFGVLETSDSKDHEVSKHIQYKRFASYLDLPENIFIPNIQRSIIKEHVDSMRKHIREYVKLEKEPIFGTIDLVLFEDKYYIVDGQHRFCAIQREYIENGISVPIHSMIYSVVEEKSIEEIFKVRNKGIPVPKFMLSVKETKKDLLKEIATYLETLCPIIFRHKGGLTRPKININTFLEHYRVTEEYKNIETVDQFKVLFEKLNMACFEKLCAMDDKEKRKYGISEHMITLWSQYKIYVGYAKDFDFLAK